MANPSWIEQPTFFPAYLMIFKYALWCLVKNINLGTVNNLKKINNDL